MEGLSHKESEYGLEMSEQENTVILTFPCSLWKPTVSSRPISTKSGRGGYRLVLDEHSTRKITINHDVGWLSVASTNQCAPTCGCGAKTWVATGAHCCLNVL